MSTSPYHAAGKLVDRVLTEHKSLKTVAFSGSNKSSSSSTSKASYAQACETLRHKPLIDAILSHDNHQLRRAVQFNDTRSKGLLYVLIFELLFGKYKSIRGGGRVKRNVVKQEKELKRVKDVVVTERASSSSDAAAGILGGTMKVTTFPRYVRVNTLKISAEEVVQILKKDIAIDDESDGRNKELEIYSDPHVPDLLVLPPSASSKLYCHELVNSGKIILQDKSSCFSSLVLAHGRRSLGQDGETTGDFIDACAAPGNKTSHLAALVSKQLHEKAETPTKEEQTSKKKKKKGKKKQGANDKSNIYAFDRSSARVKILKDRLGEIVPEEDGCIEMNPLHQDFLKADATDNRFANVKGILLDPSCSGSGIINQPERAADDGDSKSRISSLANFQLLALKHAMSSFPKVDRIVYSTCSVHEEENEQVVAKALQEVNEGDDEDTHWQLTKPKCLDHWERRGHVTAGLEPDQAACLIRCDGLKGDNTNGFFVSYFERKRCMHSGKKNGETEYEIQYPQGVSAYNGEFDDEPDDDSVLDVDTADSDTPESSGEVGKQIKKKETSGNPSKRKGGDNNKSKKAKKKLAWKKKQMEAKLKRMKKKKQQV